MPHTYNTSDPFRHLRNRNKVADTSHLPNGYGPNSSAGYYNERNALKVKEKLDTLDPELQTTILQFKSKPGETLNTTYLKIYQGWRYLVERMDTPDGKYARLKGMTTLHRKKFKIVLEWGKKGVDDGEGFDTEVVETNTGVETADSERPQTWKEEVMLWAVTSKDPSPPITSAMKMSQDDIDWLIDYLAAFSSVVIIAATHTGFKLVKNTNLADKIRAERLG